MPSTIPRLATPRNPAPLVDPGRIVRVNPGVAAPTRHSPLDRMRSARILRPLSKTCPAGTIPGTQQTQSSAWPARGSSWSIWTTPSVPEQLLGGIGLLSPRKARTHTLICETDRDLYQMIASRCQRTVLVILSWSFLGATDEALRLGGNGAGSPRAAIVAGRSFSSATS